MDQPVVSILIPTYNRVDLLPQTLQSVLEQGALLAKTEIIVSNDCSKDGTREWLENFKASNPQLKVTLHHHQQNLGGPGNWAFLLSKAGGDFVFLLSDDDCMAPGFLENYFSAIEKNPAADIVYSGLEYCDDKMKGLSTTELSSQAGLATGIERLKNQLLAHHMVMSAMYRTKILRDGGGWQGKYGTHLDSAAFAHSALRARQTYFINKPLLKYRIGGSTWSTFKVEKQRNLYACYRKIIDDLVREAKVVDASVVPFLKTQYAGHAQNILNGLHIKFEHGNISKNIVRRLLVDLAAEFPEALLLPGFYKMGLVGLIGGQWLAGLRRLLNKPDLKKSEVSTFERMGS